MVRSIGTSTIFFPKKPLLVSIKLGRGISQAFWEAVSIHVEIREENDPQPQILSLGMFESEL